MILRAAYATRGRGGLGRAKAGARYVIHRPSDTAQREYRTGFDADYDRMERGEVYDRPEAAEGTYFYRLTLAPGEGRHVEADLHDWTRHIMDRLEERAGDCDWVAWEHTDHSNHDHVHVIAVLDRRLDRDDLRDLREHADEVWQRERERCRDPLDAELERLQERDLGETIERDVVVLSSLRLHGAPALDRLKSLASVILNQLLEVVLLMPAVPIARRSLRLAAWY